MASLAPQAMGHDPKREVDAYIAVREKALYRVIGPVQYSMLLEVENCATLHRCQLAPMDVAAARLVKAAPISDLETVIAQTPSLPNEDPDAGKGDQ